jgi:hypothetical protein
MTWYTTYTPEEGIHLAKVLAVYVVAFIAAMAGMWAVGRRNSRN